MEARILATRIVRTLIRLRPAAAMFRAQGPQRIPYQGRAAATSFTADKRSREGWMAQRSEKDRLAVLRD